MLTVTIYYTNREKTTSKHRDLNSVFKYIRLVHRHQPKIARFIIKKFSQPKDIKTENIGELKCCTVL